MTPSSTVNSRFDLLIATGGEQARFSANKDVALHQVVLVALSVKRSLTSGCTQWGRSKNTSFVIGQTALSRQMSCFNTISRP